MIRNVPRTYTARELSSELPRLLVRGAYDYLYVPWDKTSSSNMGFAFVNFCDNPTARAALSALAGQAWHNTNYPRLMQVQPARLQGLEVNLQRFKREVANRGGMVLEHTPLVFEGGVPIPLTVAFAKYCPADYGVPPGLHECGKARTAFQAEVLSNVEFFDDATDSDDDSEKSFTNSGGSSSDGKMWASEFTVPSYTTLDMLPCYTFSATTTSEELPVISRPSFTIELALQFGCRCAM